MKIYCSLHGEHIKNSNNNYIFKHLNLKSNSYFNGGVLILNYRKWINEETFEKLQNTVANNKKDLLWWDQDILNQVVDGNFLELNNFYNFKLSLDWKINEDYINNEVVFLHYQEKIKTLEHFRNSSRAFKYISKYIYRITIQLRALPSC